MEENPELNKTELLIDFSSPVSKRPVLTPLIPVPIVKDKILVSPTNSNPFDVVARQTDSPSFCDPFEHVFKSAFHISNNCKTNDCEYTENVVSKDKDDLNISPIPICNTVIVAPENSRVEQSEKIKIHGNMAYKNENSEDVFQAGTVQSSVTTLKKTSKPVIIPDGDYISESQASSDFSTEEGLKAVIAKRVNKCIQNALKNNLNSRFSKSNDDLKVSVVDANIKTSLNRSVDVFTQSSVYKENVKLNKSSIEPSAVTGTYSIENKSLVTPDSSMGLLDYPSGEISNIEDSIFLPNENEEVFQEANKLARTFSRIAESFCNSGSENEDDVFSCKPRWLYTDSSEDEEEKLRNDPALNIRVSLTNSLLHAPDSPALVAFKAKNRRSLDLHSTSGIPPMKESGMKRSHSTGSKINAVPDISAVVTSVPVVLLNQEEQQIKLKKKPTGDTKKGPMKAIIPVQSMMKESLPCEGKITNNKETSPVWKQNSVLAVTSPNKDNNKVGLQPVASSTPNKAVTVMPSLSTPSIEIPSNHRRSLGSTLESRKSRSSIPEEGSKQRSSSANSSIPTPVVPPKALKGFTAVKAIQKPKSTSSLLRMSSNNAQANTQRQSKPEKNTTKQTKSTINPRALNEMKSQSARSAGRVRSAVSAISSLVSGKGKKVAVRGKENRVPV